MLANAQGEEISSTSSKNLNHNKSRYFEIIKINEHFFGLGGGEFGNLFFLLNLKFHCRISRIVSGLALWSFIFRDDNAMHNPNGQW